MSIAHIDGATAFPKLQPRLGRGMLLVLGLVFVVVLALNAMLGRQIRHLETARTDSLQWNLAQMELETANVRREILAARLSGAAGSDRIPLRFEIFLSRINLLQEGDMARLYDDPEAVALLERIAATTRQLDALLADAASPRSLETIAEGLRHLQPLVRALALHGVNQVLDDSAEHRLGMKRQAEMTAAAGLGLLAAMFVMLLSLDRQRRRVLDKDAVLVETTRRMGSIIGASLDAVICADHRGRITDFSPAAEEIFGWSREEILGQTLRDTIIPARFRDAHDRGMARFLSRREGKVVGGGRVELRAQRRCGAEFPVEMNLTSIEGPSGPVFISYLRDISDWKQSEARLIGARDAAKAANEAKSRFLSVMSHEMRTPLNGIMGVLDLVRCTDLDAAQHRHVEVALASSEVLLQLVNEALDITRIEAGEDRVETAPFALGPLLRQVRAGLLPLAAEKGLTLDLDLDAEGWFEGDEKRIRQVITNLIGNAIKFTRTGGITVTAVTEGNAVTIAVADTGVGIPASDLDRIFEEFVAKSHPGGRQSRSDGLGLAISRRLARLMSGDLVAFSAEGEGSRFELSLPRVPPAAIPAEATAAPAPSTRAAASQSVLVVEDSPINRLVLRGMLERLGHHVTEAEHGEAALAMLGRGFDLVLMDFEMPVLGGLETTQRIRRLDAPLRGLQVIGLTAHASAETCALGAEAGMDRVLSKPLRLTTLADLLGEHAPKPVAEVDLDEEVLSELAETAGTERVKSALDGLLKEWQDMARQIGTDAPGPGLADRAHRMKGAAAMLGMAGLSRLLAGIETGSGGLDVDEFDHLLRDADARARALLRRQPQTA
ncbi:ATP-binding protein [Limimaricola sp.]|uniref:ATP-binding protein n=1 Tax=Limimaricola sp. TaxID=2211665 RepID=UPI0040586F9E